VQREIEELRLKINGLGSVNPKRRAEPLQTRKLIEVHDLSARHR
jgi:hypothetical protein